MSKYDYINQLKELLKDVNEEDAKIIVEEYEEYIREEVSAGKEESEVIASLESVEEVAKNVIDELGKEERIKPKIKITNGNVLIEKDGKKIKIDEEGVSFDGVYFGSESSEDDVEPKNFTHTTEHELDLAKKVVIYPNNLPISLVPGDEKTKIKNLPNDVDVRIEEDNDLTTITFEKKSMLSGWSMKDIKIELAEEVDSLEVNNDNGPLSVFDLNLGLLQVNGSNGPVSLKENEIKVAQIITKNGPLTIKDCHFDSIEVNSKNGPVTIKDIEASHIKVTSKNSPITFKNNQTKYLSFKSGNGPTTIKGIELVEGDIRCGNGPTTIKDINGQKLTLQTGRGPVTKKDLEVEELINL